jgi:deaminated glutathione amidase
MENWQVHLSYTLCLFLARAIESQCYFLASAQYGRHNEKRESYGHSLAVDPWGAVMGDAGGCDEPTGVVPSIICCDIDLDYLRTIRERMPVAQHRESSEWSF